MDVESFATALSDIDSKLRPQVDTGMVENVLDPVSRAIVNIDEIKADMRVRENVKIDLDARGRKVDEACVCGRVKLGSNDV